jgi:hypothetical protein
MLIFSNDLIHETGDNKVTNGIDNGDALINTSPLIVTTDEEQSNEATESTVNDDDDENRSRKTFNSKVKYSSMPYHRSPYYIHDQSYGPAPYYYYPPPPSVSIEKSASLMFISAQKPSSSPTSRDSQTGNSTSVSPQNLPPRLRQTSTTENDPNSQIPSTTSTTSPSTAAPPLPATNGRRHRSILPRGSNNYYSTHLPPPLMATPPGVLYTYPPAVHPPGHIAYSIRPSDEFELLALQQQMMNLPPGSILWPPPTGLSPHGHPLFPSYSMNGPPPPPPPPSTYMFNNATVTQLTNSFLNPEAAEWVPPPNESDSLSENQILIDDEINFPPLNSTTNSIQTTTNIKDSNEDNSEPTDDALETTSTNINNLNDNPSISTDSSNVSSQSNIKTELITNSSSSQDDINKSSIKITPITYSTIISQTSENNKSNQNNTHNQQRSQQQSTNHVNNQLPPRDRTAKQRPPIASSSSSSNSRRRQPLNNNHRNTTRNPLTSQTNSLPKQQQPQLSSTEISDDWIEVKSKKTKKFDRSITDNSSEKLILDEQIPKSLSPPLSLTSTGDNTTTTTFTSEDDFDEKDNQDLVIIMNNDLSNDYNRIILDDIHRRLNNNERLLIIMRGCPGKYEFHFKVFDISHYSLVVSISLYSFLKFLKKKSKL